jgi:hypothetical protein
MTHRLAEGATQDVSLRREAQTACHARLSQLGVPVVGRFRRHDRDDATFDVGTLREWKHKAEAHALDRLLVVRTLRLGRLRSSQADPDTANRCCSRRRRCFSSECSLEVAALDEFTVLLGQDELMGSVNPESRARAPATTNRRARRSARANRSAVRGSRRIQPSAHWEAPNA